MRRATGSQPLTIGVIIGFVLAAAGAARAADDESTATRQLNSRQVIDRIEQNEPEEISWFERLSIDRGKGFQYRQKMSMGDHELEFRVRGPVFKTKGQRQKKYGLRFELRF